MRLKLMRSALHSARFSASVVGSGYRVFKHAWSLALLWILLLAHLGLELTRRDHWLWVVDAPLALFFLAHWLAWATMEMHAAGVARGVYLAFAWLPIAFALYTAQSLIAFSGGGLLLGRAPVHALTIGFFGSMLVAMVTRVTQGHSGRPLEMGAIPWLTFVLLQFVACARIYAEFAHDAPLWLVIAAFGWLLAFLPWSRVRCGSLRPRASTANRVSRSPITRSTGVHRW